MFWWEECGESHSKKILILLLASKAALQAEQLSFLHLDRSYRSDHDRDNCNPQASDHSSTCSSSPIKGRSFIPTTPYPIRTFTCHSYLTSDVFLHLAKVW